MSKKRTLRIGDLVKGIESGEIVALSQSITLLESTNRRYREMGEEILEKVKTRRNRTYRIGISGVPGAGKSTFINAFGTYLCEQGYKVAVLAVDPSSTLTGGSILGDKMRMYDLSLQQNAFIRPSPTSGTLGGVTRTTRECMQLCEGAGFDVILVETVGVGQVETIVRSMVDFFLLIALTGAGDEIQGMKRGILELIDGVIINKADGSNLELAKQTASQYEQMLSLFSPLHEGWKPLTTICSSVEKKGIHEIWVGVEAFFQHQERVERIRRHQEEGYVKQGMDALVIRHFFNNKEVLSFVGKLQKDVQEGVCSSNMALKQFEVFLQGEKGQMS